MDLIAPLTEEERKRYEVINASIEVSAIRYIPGVRQPDSFTLR